MSKIYKCGKGNDEKDGPCESDVYDPDTENQKEVYPIDVKTQKIHICKFGRSRFKKEIIRDDELNWEYWEPRDEEYLRIEFEEWKDAYIKKNFKNSSDIQKWHPIMPKLFLSRLGKILMRSEHAIEEQLKNMNLIPR